MFGHLRSGFSCFCGDLLYTCSISIALVIHSFDPALGLTNNWCRDCARKKPSFQTDSKLDFVHKYNDSDVTRAVQH